MGRRVPSPGPGTPDFDYVDSAQPGTARIKDSVLDSVFDNSDRREIGKGLVGRLFKRSYRGDRIDSDIKAQLDEVDDHRYVQHDQTLHSSVHTQKTFMK